MVVSSIKQEERRVNEGVANGNPRLEEQQILVGEIATGIESRDS